MKDPKPNAKTAPAAPDHPVVVQGLKHYQAIWFTIRHKFGNLTEDEIDDVLQETYIQLTRKAYTYRGDSEVQTWLTRVAINVALALLHKRGKRLAHVQTSGMLPDELLEMQAERTRPAQEMPDTDLMREETAEQVNACLRELDTDEFDVVYLADMRGLPNAEIADVLELSVGAVKTRLHRARNHLHDIMVRHELTP